MNKVQELHLADMISKSFNIHNSSFFFFHIFTYFKK